MADTNDQRRKELTEYYANLSADERRNRWSTVLPAFTKESGQTVRSD